MIFTMQRENNYENSFNTQSEVNINFSFHSSIPFSTLITNLYELYRIKNIGTKHEISLYRSAQLGKFANMISMLKLPFRISNLFKNCMTSQPNNDNGITLAKIALVAPSIAAVDFYFKDSELLANADAIVNYNKETSRNVTTDKIVQLTWFVLNKTLLSMGLFSAITNHDERVTRTERIKTALTLKALENLSEIVRKHYRYKAELGNYKNFVKQSA